GGTASAAPARLLTRRGSLLRLGGGRWNAAVRRIDDEPRPAAARVQVLPPEQLRVPFRILDGAGRAIDDGVAPLLAQLVEFRRRDVLQTTAIELRRPLEGDTALVAVRVHAGEIRITPRRPTGLPILDIRGQRHRGLSLLQTLGDAQNEFAFRLFGRFHIARRLRLPDGGRRLPGERNGGERRGKTDDDGCAQTRTMMTHGKLP